MKAKLEVSGITALLRDIQRATAAGREVASSAVEQLAEETASTARGRIVAGQGYSAPGAFPRSKTGRLERSIRVVLRQAKNTTAMVGTDQLHGRFLEVGTGKMEPRPWLLPSFEAAQSTVGRGLAAEFEGKI